MKKRIIFGISLIFLSFGLVRPQQINAKEQKMNKQVVAVVNIKAKWYYFDFLLKNGYTNSIPEYKIAPGLLFKYYHYIQRDSQKDFGGIYLWKNMESAKSWYNKNWIDKIKEKRGSEPRVDLYEVESIKQFVPDDFDFDSVSDISVAVFISLISTENIKNVQSQSPGKLRTYILNNENSKYGIILFENRSLAEQYVIDHKLNSVEYYSTPVLLKN